MKKLLKVGMAGVLSIGISMAANAVDSEETIEYRQATMTIIKWNVAQMGAMMRGKIPFDAQVFANRAANLAVLSQMPLEGFTPGSDKGDTDAKPKIWQNWDNFNAKMTHFQQEAAKLAEVAKTATRAKIGSQFVKTVKTCKGCHKKYKP